MWKGLVQLARLQNSILILINKWEQLLGIFLWELILYHRIERLLAIYLLVLD